MQNEWIRTTLSNVIDIISGGTPKTSIPEYWNGNIPWLSVVDFNTGYRWVSSAEKHITERGLSESATRLLSERDVIISARGTVGALAQLSKPMAFNQSCYGVRGKCGTSDTDFIYYFLLQAVAKMKQVAHGGVFDTITRDTFKLIALSLPPLPEQRAIAHILGTLDDKIELNRKQNQTLEAMARAMFKAWFVEFEPVRAKLEGRWQRGQSLPGLPAHLYDLFPNRLVDSELGEIPEGWGVGELSSHLDVLETGRRPKGGVGGIYEGVPSVGAESIIGVGQFDYGKTKYVSEEFFTTMKSGHAECMDVMLYKDGGKPGDFRPRVSMFGRGFPFDRYAINEHVFRMRSESLGQAFLYLQISHERILNDLRNRGGKAAIPGINQSEVRTLHLVVPPCEVLVTFENAVLPVIEGILEHAVGSRTLAHLRDTLLPKLISGELRVPDAEVFLQERGL